MQFADELETADDFETALAKLIAENHPRTQAYHLQRQQLCAEAGSTEAEKRGLLNLKTTPDALPYFIKPENIAMFTRHGVFYRAARWRCRYEVLMENYAKVLNIEAMTMLDMANRDILPAVLTNVGELTDTLLKKKELGLSAKTETELCKKLSSLADSLSEKIAALSETICGAKAYADDAPAEAVYYRDHVVPAMNELRAVADEMEILVAKKYWPFPTHGDILFSVQ